MSNVKTKCICGAKVLVEESKYEMINWQIIRRWYTAYCTNPHCLLPSITTSEATSEVEQDALQEAEDAWIERVNELKSNAELFKQKFPKRIYGVRRKMREFAFNVI